MRYLLFALRRSTALKPFFPYKAPSRFHSFSPNKHLLTQTELAKYSAAPSALTKRASHIHVQEDPDSPATTTDVSSMSNLFLRFLAFIL